MPLINDQCEWLAKMLNVKKGIIQHNKSTQETYITADDGTTLTGLGTISRYLAEKSEAKDLLGKSCEENALLGHWLEYRIVQLDRLNGPTDVANTLKELNGYLENKVYFIGNRLTLADVLIYYGLHGIYAKLSFQDKETYNNLSRWFDLIQHQGKVRQKLPLSIVSKTRLYTDTYLL